VIKIPKNVKIVKNEHEKTKKKLSKEKLAHYAELEDRFGWIGQQFEQRDKHESD
jgi:hypothetical protein